MLIIKFQFSLTRFIVSTVTGGNENSVEKCSAKKKHPRGVAYKFYVYSEMIALCNGGTMYIFTFFSVSTSDSRVVLSNQ
jgi:hypothetical protein